MKKRGRPPKNVRVEGAEVDFEVKPVVIPDPATLVSTAYPWQVEVPEKNDAAQALAKRIWLGQSPDLPRNERIRRITAALQNQGMSMEGVKL